MQQAEIDPPRYLYWVNNSRVCSSIVYSSGENPINFQLLGKSQTLTAQGKMSGVEGEIEERIVEGASGKRVRTSENGAGGSDGGASKRRVVGQASGLNDLEAFALNKCLVTFRWPEHLLILFLEREGQCLDDQKQIHCNKLLERLKSLNLQEDDRTGTPDSLDQLFQDFKNTLLPLPTVCNDGTARFTTVNDVLSYAVTDLLTPTPLLPPNWHLFKVRMDAGQFARYIEDILYTASAFKPIGVLDSKLGGFGVFFCMPSWVANLVLYIMKRDKGIQDQVAALGYRGFAPAGHRERTYEHESYFTFICGYNMCRRPAWEGHHGISLLDGFFPHLHRNLVERLSREYQQRVEAAFASTEDSDA